MQRKSSRKTRSQKEVGAVLELVFAEETTQLVSNGDELIHVPSNLRYHGFEYIQLYRGLRSCVYRQTYSKKTVGFEVFIIRIQQETILYGKSYKKHELWSKDGDFGKIVWSCFTLEEAIDKYNVIEISFGGIKDVNIHEKERRAS